MIEELEEECTCDEMDDTDYHSCPYASDVLDEDNPEYCNCCPYHIEQCAMDI